MNRSILVIVFAFSFSFLQAQNNEVPISNFANSFDPSDSTDTYNLDWPAWVFSHWIWEGEGTTQSATQIADDYLAHDIPVGAIIIDSPWETEYNTFVVDDSLYPGVQGMVDYFHSKNIKVLFWITGIIDTNVHPLYDSIAALGYFMQQNATDGPALVDWWKGTGSIIDWYNPDAVAWWKSMMDPILDLGIDGWKCDGTDYYAIGAKYSPYLAANVSRLNYSHSYYQLFHDYTRERLGNKRVDMSRPIDNYGQIDIGGDFVAFTPREICFSCWVGDQDGDWGGMEDALNNMFHSDAYNYLAFGSDIGGYRSDETLYPGLGRDKELFIRWAQLGALSPLMENGGGGEHRPWMFDEETTNIYRRFSQLHTSLIPYLMPESEAAHTAGVSLMQFFNKTDYSFMLGPDIFVTPLMDAGGNKTVHFPSGDNWVYLFDTTVVKTGGSSEALNFPLSEFPVYVRQGSQYDNIINDPGIVASVEEDAKELNLSLYPNPANNIITVTPVVSKGQYKISNVMGQLITSGILGGQKSFIDISSLSPGIYYLQLQSNDGVGVKKFEVVK